MDVVAMYRVGHMVDLVEDVPSMEIVVETAGGGNLERTRNRTLKLVRLNIRC